LPWPGISLADFEEENKMTEVGLSPSEEARVQQAADEAFRVLTGDEDVRRPVGEHLVETLRQLTREAPLHALAVAFLLGVLIARRR
jgi:hypothetical protein